MHVCGSATPRISRCKLQAKKCGVWAYEKAKPVLTDCAIEECGQQGVKLFDCAVVRMLRYAVLPSQHLAYEHLSQQRAHDLISLVCCTLTRMHMCSLHWLGLPSDECAWQMEFCGVTLPVGGDSTVSARASMRATGKCMAKKTAARRLMSNLSGT